MCACWRRRRDRRARLGGRPHFGRPRHSAWPGAVPRAHRACSIERSAVRSGRGLVTLRVRGSRSRLWARCGDWHGVGPPARHLRVWPCRRR
eukprot:3874457-Pleurochrysis_carterae.AAC.1